MLNQIKLLSVAFAGALLGSLQAASAQGFTFADTAWYSSPNEVVQHLTNKGYTASDSSTDDGDGLSFSGTLMNKEALVFAYFNDENELLKVATFMLTSDESDEFFAAETSYKTLKGLLTERYGAPKDSFEFFSDPYYRGDGYEDTAVSSGNATFTTFWESGTGDLMVLKIDEDVDVGVIYESARWSAYLDQQELASSDDF